MGRSNDRHCKIRDTWPRYVHTAMSANDAVIHSLLHKIHQYELIFGNHISLFGLLSKNKGLSKVKG